MSTTHPQFTARIEGFSEAIFDLLDARAAGRRPGSVTGYDPPKYIVFHHTMLLKQGPLTANIDVHILEVAEPLVLYLFEPIGANEAPQSDLSFTSKEELNG